jgi:hypothetical protein
MTMFKTGAPVPVSPLPDDEAAILAFLKGNAGTKYTTEEVGRAVRPTVMKKDQLCQEGRVARNWASTRLNSLFRKHLVYKEGTKGRSQSMKWWA